LIFYNNNNNNNNNNNEIPVKKGFHMYVAISLPNN